MKEPEARAAFLRSPLVELAAFAAFHFLELLVGPKAAGLRVKDPAKLGALQGLVLGWLGSGSRLVLRSGLVLGSGLA